MKTGRGISREILRFLRAKAYVEGGGREGGDKGLREKELRRLARDERAT